MQPEEVAATRTALLDVAQKLYESGGPEAMSFRAIASAYGCSTTMPYSYFDSKAAIVDALRIRAYEWMQGLLEDAAHTAPDPMEALRALAAAYVRAASDRPRLYQLLYAGAGAMAETDPEFVEAKLGALGVCQRVIEAVADAAGLTLRADPVTTAHLFWVAAHGLVSLEEGGFLVVGRTLDDLLPVLFTALSVGMVEQEEA
jgi:AcrR family transcriptional regulator